MNNTAHSLGVSYDIKKISAIRYPNYICIYTTLNVQLGFSGREEHLYMVAFGNQTQLSSFHNLKDCSTSTDTEENLKK